ncbi:hypothetical protein B9N43_10840 [Denitratisoma sp. DHT3]|uniref:pilus assembly FimT family protein n=1 Tax=Denitratisoma sp. DHT3 TaxID=1981880 RepID=UPI001198393C|nr:prepilin-type N-terminal cleavage/methylation domain-containing protein [Denitratisoma sp. DHT3]QDX81706.1 hypothetical protein B9N43_10840 [Denitratisoma sp. DHT3]
MKAQRKKQTGFTLIEAIVVIVITGIVASMLVVFVKGALDNYFDAVRRAELTDAADISLRRFAREIRLALPNSLRVDCAADSTRCFIEFIPTMDGGRYRDAGDGSTGGNILDFTDSTETSFDALGPVIAGAGDFIVVYNLGPGFAPADAYTGGNRATIAPGYAGGNPIQLTTNPFAAQSPPLSSPNSRFHVVPSTGPVTYVCQQLTPGQVLRFSNYRTTTPWTSQPISVATGAVLLGGVSTVVENQATCTVTYTPAVLQRNGILFIQLNIFDGTSSGERIQVFQQIHVDNSP